MFLEIPQDRAVCTYVAENSMAMQDERVRQKLADMDYEIVSQQVFGSISGTISPQGILSVVKMQETSLEKILCAERAEHDRQLLLLLEDIQDPGNLGTIMRTAEAAGVTGVILSKGTVDIYNPKVVRSTMGTIFRLPFVYVEDLLMTAGRIQEQGIALVASHLEGTSWYDEVDYQKDIAVCIGNEGRGLSQELSGMADIRVKIPMHGQVESLNAAVAASILVYEADRQRHSGR